MKKLLIAVLALGLVAAFSVPAIAATHVGGILFTTIAWDDRDADKMDRTAVTAAQRAARPGVQDNTLLHIFNTAASRFYTKWDNEDNVGLYFELGTNFGMHENQEAVYMRHYYGWWKVNPGFRLLVGMDTSPFAPLNASALAYFNFLDDGSTDLAGIECNAISAGYGNIYVERCAQIRGEFDFGPHFLHIALCDWTNTSNAANVIGTAVIPTGGPGFAWNDGVGLRASNVAGAFVAEDTKLPRLDIGAKVQAGPVAIYPGFSYLKRSFNMVMPGDDDSVVGWAGSLGAKFGVGPFTFTAEGNIGKNWDDIALIDGVTNAAAVNAMSMIMVPPGQTNRVVYDTDCWGWFIDISFKMGIATPSIYYGVQKAENEDYPGTASDWAFKNWNLGFRVPINVAKGFQIAPEYVHSDFGDEIVGVGGVRGDRDWGSYDRYGVMFQITF